MRLIDADDLLQSLAVAFDTFDPRFLRDRSIREGLKLAKTAIGEAKTINTEPALHEPWISVKDRLPEGSGKYVASNSENSYIGVLNYSKQHKTFNVHDGCSKKEVERYAIPITHWMPLPEPPQKSVGKRGKKQHEQDKD